MLRRPLLSEPVCKLARRTTHCVDLVIVCVLDDLPALDVTRCGRRERLRQHGSECEISVQQPDTARSRLAIQL